MKHILIFLIVGSSWSFGASQAANSCLIQVIENESIDTTNIDVNCAKQSPVVVMGLKYLCTPDGRDISGEYRAYHSYDVAYRAALLSYLNAPDTPSKAAAGQRMSKIDQNWQVLGFKSDAGNAVGAVKLNFRCLPN